MPETGRDLTAAIAELCAAIDAGNDTLLPILADALEEAERYAEAAGLRLVGDRRPAIWTIEWPDGFGFRCQDPPGKGWVTPDVFRRLMATAPDSRATPTGPLLLWPAYSAAFLALAAALATT